MLTKAPSAGVRITDFRRPWCCDNFARPAFVNGSLANRALQLFALCAFRRPAPNPSQQVYACRAALPRPLPRASRHNATPLPPTPRICLASAAVFLLLFTVSRALLLWRNRDLLVDIPCAMW